MSEYLPSDVFTSRKRGRDSLTEQEYRLEASVVYGTHADWVDPQTAEEERVDSEGDRGGVKVVPAGCRGVQQKVGDS